ncbi:MAG: 2Fe-2S iron-sulfur cluster binding domain-containing protein [Magnetococcales bacterium]|nr:2Fe-2S iron-sulfur cluster binding domain-containing protein [Magnetococcales bacterium]
MDRADHVSILYDGEKHEVPSGRTILSALEEIGIGFVRGVGCRGGVCGACTVLYRISDETEFHAALMCQEPVQAEMEILPLPYFPQKKVRHSLDLPEGETPHYRVVNYYPEINRCIMCGECSRLCPVGIDVMGYVGMIKRGELREAAWESFTCVQCQACALRCPGQIPQPNAALTARLFHGRHQVPQAEHLTRALEKNRKEDIHAVIGRLRRMKPVEIQALYQRREIEPQNAPPGTWLPEDRTLIMMG